MNIFYHYNTLALHKKLNFLLFVSHSAVCFFSCHIFLPSKKIFVRFFIRLVLLSMTWERRSRTLQKKKRFALWCRMNDVWQQLRSSTERPHTVSLILKVYIRFFLMKEELIPPKLTQLIIVAECRHRRVSTAILCACALNILLYSLDDSTIITSWRDCSSCGSPCWHETGSSTLMAHWWGRW